MTQFSGIGILSLEFRPRYCSSLRIQLRFIRTKDLGLDKHQVVTMTLPARCLREAILADSRILGASQSVPPGSDPRAAIEVSWEGKNQAVAAKTVQAARTAPAESLRFE